MLGGEVYVAVPAGEAHEKPFQALAPVAPAPYAAGEFDRQIVMQPAPALPDDLGLAGADLFLQLPQGRLTRGLARLDAALRHLPCRHRRHVEAAGDEHLSQRVEQHDADRRTIAERLSALIGLLHPVPSRPRGLYVFS